jgi:redox-sensitive bicupin YhaK (pirin superfamily)
MVGPFVFLDQLGPVSYEAGQGMAILPHPHIGLSTVTYLFEGEIVHRDTLGTVQTIRAGEVNWMTAGKGIAHSERSVATSKGRMFGIQIWVALPKAFEESEPAFVHHGFDALPTWQDAGARVRLVAGQLSGARSPVQTLSDLFYAEVTLEAGAIFKLSAEHVERAAYIVEGRVSLREGILEPGSLAVFHRGSEVLLCAAEPSRILVLGGEPLEAPRHIWWNFVSSSKERIEQAKEDWRAQKFGMVPEEREFLPLPGESAPPVNYP